VLTGAVGTEAAPIGPAGAATTPVACESWVAWPPALVAVTATRIVCPTSPLDIVYVLDVEWGMAVQLSPEASQSCHWSSNESGLLVHEPDEAVST
jgi:hypothetical protein